MDFLKTLAPLLGTALAGPLGGAAAAFIADKLGIESKTVEAVNEVLNSGKLSPDQLSQIKLAELDFKKFLEQNRIDLAKLDVDNTKSARDMQTATKATTPAILTYLITCGFFGILASMMLYEVHPSEPLLIMLGALGAAFGAAVNFWLGSSHGSSVKSEQIERLKGQ